MSWSWKTKPRSIIKTIQWFPYFASLKGENWNGKSTAVSRKDGKAVHPVRRQYIYSAHRDEDTWLSSISWSDYLSGRKDKKETEANGRMDKGAYEFFGFGYVNKKGAIEVTEVGNKIVQGIFDDEDYLKQLLKLRLPNFVYKESKIKNKRFIFPMQVILQAFVQYESLNRSELALIFGCEDTEDIPDTLTAIGLFKEEYKKLKNKNDTTKVKKLFSEIYQNTYGKMQNRPDSYYEYAEALSRTLIYTGLFISSGRSIATKIRVAEHSKAKVKLLQQKFVFTHPEHTSLEEYMQWFGSLHNIMLPWENIEERKVIIAEKADILSSKIKNADKDYEKKAEISLEEIEKIVADAETAKDNNQLKEFEHLLSEQIISHNENYFIKTLSKTRDERDKILDKFDDILANEDMSALWLEVNTWKSLIAISGEQIVKRNFKIEDDLTPKSFAPGVGNTPDMELYKDNYIIVPEVSLMTGVRQWEHEASSVIDHVLSFITEYKEKQVLGLFLSSKINVRTLWQFFILNKESWVGEPVPVIPLTIEQYVDVVQYIYSNEYCIDDFKELLVNIADRSINCKDYHAWEDEISDCIHIWKQSKSV